MFEKIIERLLYLRAPVTHKFKIPLAGIRAFDAILESDSSSYTTAIRIAVSEFSKYSKDDPQAISDFKKILTKEFSGLDNSKLLKKKAKTLRDIWKIEARTLASKTRRNKWVSIRVTKEEYERILRQAQSEGLDISSYIRKKLGLEDNL